MKNSISQFSYKISVLFMVLLSTAVLAISTIFVVFINFDVRRKQAQELREVISRIEKTLVTSESNSSEIYFDVPLNISYSIFNRMTEDVIFTNDSFLPQLQDTKLKPKRYFEKDFFMDGNLNIYYIAKNLEAPFDSYTIITAIDLENDYGTAFFSTFPRILLIAIIPVFLAAFFVSLIITKKMVKPFERERQFSNDVSHELKTPLAIINGHASLLLRWGRTDSKMLEESLLEIKKETQSMQSIIENLTEISQYESGRRKPVITEFSAGELLERLRNETYCFVRQNLAPDSLLPDNFDFIIKLKKDFFMESDEEMLHQVLTALITNSLKYNSNNCTIILSAEKKGKTIILEEEDNGVGIDEKIMPFIFDRFYRGDSSHSQEVSGSGLGLSIAKTLISCLDGKISVRKAAEKGVVFRLEFQDRNR